MKPPPLQIHKLKQAIKTFGVTYEFTRKQVDNYGEPIPDTEPEVVAIPKGIFSETGTGFILVVSDAATVQSKPTPMITTLLDDAKGIQREDVVKIADGKEYKVTSVNDIGNFGYFATVTLEVILNEFPV